MRWLRAQAISRSEIVTIADHGSQKKVGSKQRLRWKCRSAQYARPILRRRSVSKFSHISPSTPGAALRFNSKNADRATPSSRRTPTDYSLPVSRRTAKDSVRYPGKASISTCQRLPTASAAVRAPNQEVLGHTLDRIAQSPKEALTARMISDEILTRQCSNAIRKLGVFCLI
jgi:hypothetical protein